MRRKEAREIERERVRRTEERVGREERERDISDIELGQVPALPGTESLWPDEWSPESQIKTKQQEGQNNQQIKRQSLSSHVLLLDRCFC